MNNKYQEALDYLASLWEIEGEITVKSNPFDRFNRVETLIEDKVRRANRGKVKILQELVDKETPKKVKIMETVISKRYVFYDYECVNCGCEVSAMNDNYCSHCGQRITLKDSDENE